MSNKDKGEKMSKKVILETHSLNGQCTVGNEWAKYLGMKIGAECDKHGKGFLFAPFGGSNTSCKSFFMSSLMNPVDMGACLSMIAGNFIASGHLSNLDVDGWLKAIVESAKECAGEISKRSKTSVECYGRFDDEKTD